MCLEQPRCEATELGDPCDNIARWVVRANNMTQHRTCTMHKKVLEVWNLAGFEALPLLALSPYEMIAE